MQATQYTDLLPGVNLPTARSRVSNVGASAICPALTESPHVRTTTLLLLALLSACSGPVPPAFGPAESVAFPGADGSVGPRLATGGGRQLLMSWMEPGESGGTLRLSDWDGDAWSAPIDVTNDARMFINWADLPSVLALERNAQGHTRWIAHWLSRSSDKPYAYDVRVSWSDDRGRTWSGPVTPHTDGTPTEHGFVSKFRAAGGVGLIWLDGRNTASEAGPDPAATAMTLRAATIAPDGALSGEHVIDDIVCDCCGTAAVVTSSGTLVAYRDRTAGEVRDIYVSRFTNGKWSPGKAVADDGWQIAGCPVNGPALAASGSLVAVAWFTAADDAPRIRVAVSRDGGQSFSDPVLVAAGPVGGYVDIAWLDAAQFAVTWLEPDGDRYAVRARGMTAKGAMGEPVTVGTTSLARVVPQAEYRDNALLVAWTDAVDETSRVHVARLPLASRTP